MWVLSVFLTDTASHKTSAVELDPMTMSWLVMRTSDDVAKMSVKSVGGEEADPIFYS